MTNEERIAQMQAINNDYTKATEELRTDYIENLFAAVDTIVQKRIENLPYDKTIVATIEDASNAEDGMYIVNDGTSTFMACSENVNYQVGQQVYINIPQGDFSKQRVIIGKYFSNENNKFSYNYVSPMNSFANITGNVIPLQEQEYYSLTANGDSSCIIWQGEVSLKDFDTLGISGEFRSWLNHYNDIVSGTYGIKVDILSKQVTAQLKENLFYHTFYFSSDEMLGDPYNYDTFYLQEKTFDISGIKQIDYVIVSFYQDCKFRTSETYLPLNTSPNLFLKNPVIAFGYDINNFQGDTVLPYSFDNEVFYDSVNDDIRSKYPDINYGDEETVINLLTDINKKTIGFRWIHFLTEEEGSGTYNLSTSGISSSRAITIDSEDDFNEPFQIKWYRYNFIEPIPEEVSYDPLVGNYWEELIDQRNHFSITIDPDINKVDEQFKVVIEYPSKLFIEEEIEKELDKPYGLYDTRLLYYSTPITFKLNEEESGEGTDYLLMKKDELGNIPFISYLQNEIDRLNTQLQDNILIINKQQDISEEEKTSKINEITQKTNDQYEPLNRTKTEIEENIVDPYSTPFEIYSIFLELLKINSLDLIQKIKTHINGLKKSIEDDVEFRKVASIYLNKLRFKNQIRFLKNFFPKFFGTSTFNNTINYSNIEQGYLDSYASQLLTFFENFVNDFTIENLESYINDSTATNNEKAEKQVLLKMYETLSLIFNIDNEIETYRNVELSRIQNYVSSPIKFINSNPEAHLNAIKDALSNLSILVDEDGLQGIYNIYDDNGSIKDTGAPNILRVLEARYNKYETESNPVENDEIITWRIPLENSMIVEPEEGVEYSFYDAVEKRTEENEEGEVTEENFNQGLYYYEDENGDLIQITPTSTVTFNNIEEFYKRNSTTRTDENGYAVISRRGNPIQHFRIKNFCETFMTNNEIFCTVSKGNFNLTASATLTFSAPGNSGTDYTLNVEFYNNGNKFALQAKSENEEDSILNIRARLFDNTGKEITEDIDASKYQWNLVNSATKQMMSFSAVQLISSGTTCQIKSVDRTFDEDNDWDVEDFSNIVVQCEVSVPMLSGVDGYFNVYDPNKQTFVRTNQTEVKEIALSKMLPIPVIKDDKTIGGYSGSSRIVYNSAGVDPKFNQYFMVFDKEHKKIETIIENVVNEETQEEEEQVTRDVEWDIYGVEEGAENFYPQIFDGVMAVPSIFMTGNSPTSIWVIIDEKVEFILPIIVSHDVYTSKVINSWDGSLTFNENDGIILSKMMGAGHKEANNTFTGILMGDIVGETLLPGQTLNPFYYGTGLYGYSGGEKAFGFNSNGYGFIGKASSGGQILFDGNGGIIKSSNYDGINGTGTYIDLTNGTFHATKQGTIGCWSLNNEILWSSSSGVSKYIDSGIEGQYGKYPAFWAGSNSPWSSNFYVRHDGQLRATGAYISGTIDNTVNGIGVKLSPTEGIKISGAENRYDLNGTLIDTVYTDMQLINGRILFTTALVAAGQNPYIYADGPALHIRGNHLILEGAVTSYASISILNSLYANSFSTQSISATTISTDQGITCGGGYLTKLYASNNNLWSRLGADGNDRSYQASFCTYNEQGQENGYTWASIVSVSNAGNVTYRGMSDKRHKNILKETSDKETLILLKNLKVMNFNYYGENIIWNGFIAQDVRDILLNNNIGYRGYLGINDINNGKNYQDLTISEDKVRYTLDYSKFTPILWKGWQIHDKKIEELENTISQLMKEIQELKAKIM